MAQKSAARQFLLDLLLAGVTTAAGLVAFKYIHAHFDPATQKRDAARRLGDEKLRRLGRRVELDEWEGESALQRCCGRAEESAARMARQAHVDAARELRVRQRGRSPAAAGQ
jgi:hypothetical protein